MCMFPTKQGYPCGKCIDCLQKKRNDWSIRLRYEREYWLKKGCLTYMALLTYKPESVPLTSKGTQTLRQRDVQLFMKRLRKYLQKRNVFCRFFYCGEYGPTTLRPHYHILLFGLPNTMTLKQVKELLEKHWQNGFVGNKLGVCSERGIHYCTKYMINKAVKLPDDEEIEKPFTRMSKGLGMSFMYDVIEDEHGIHKGKKRSDVVQRFNPNDVDARSLYEYCRSLTDERECIEFAYYVQRFYMDRLRINGTKFKMPRYYRDRIFDGFDRYLINFADFYLYHLPHEREYAAKYGEYDATHDVPMKILMAQQKTFALLSRYVKTCSLETEFD